MHYGLLKTQHHSLGLTHFRQRQQKRQRGFRALVSIHAIHMQPVPASAVFRRVQFQPEIVPPDKPVEGPLRLLVPPDVAGRAIRFESRRNHGLRLDRLLVELRPRAVPLIETVAADRAEMASLGDLHVVEPA